MRHTRSGHITDNFNPPHRPARLPGKHRVVLASLETLEEMPADTLEIREGDEEGIERRNGWGPVEIQRGAGGAVTGVLFRRCLRVYDEQRRFAPVFDDAERDLIPCDTVLVAAGQAPDLGFLRDGGSDVEEFRPGWPRVDATTQQTTAPGVFVAGDLAHGTRLLIDAVASGKKAARSIYAYVTGRALHPDVLTAHLALPRYRREVGYERLRRFDPPARDVGERLSESRDAAVAEASVQHGRSLVPVLAARGEAAEAAMREAVPNLRRSRSSMSSGAGWAAGRAAGDRAALAGQAPLPARPGALSRG